MTDRRNEENAARLPVRPNMYQATIGIPKTSSGNALGVEHRKYPRDLRRTELRGKGAEFITEPKHHRYEIRCFMRDPDGYIIEVAQSSGVSAFYKEAETQMKWAEESCFVTGS